MNPLPRLSVLLVMILAMGWQAAAQCPLAVTPLDSTTGDAVPWNHTPEDLARALLGSGVPFSNVQFRGARISAGTFTNGQTLLGFDTGIVLSSGNISNVAGPNLFSNLSANLKLPGDADLSGLAAAAPTYDATVLEFDFVPATNRWVFPCVFGSEEYSEFANSQFNDVFGLWVNGANVAALPDSLTGSSVVTINNINGGNPPGTNAKNPALYRDNPVGAQCTELDGFTAPLEFVAAVLPLQNNHFKLAIADTGDRIYDSAVFLKAGLRGTDSPPVVRCPAPLLTSSCAGEQVSLQAQVEDEDSGSLTVVWAVNGELVATNLVTSPQSSVSAEVPLIRHFPLGTNQVTVTVSDGQFSDSCSTTVTVVLEDIVPPTINFTMVYWPQTLMLLEIQDTCSGLAVIRQLGGANCTSSIPAFTLCTTSPVQVVVTRLDERYSSYVVLEAIDCAGNRTVLDPVVTTLEVTQGGRVVQTFTDIPLVEHYVCVVNGEPGLKAMQILVNGALYRLPGLTDGEVRRLDIGRAMAGDANTVRLVGHGKTGASAVVVISDTATGPSTIGTPKGGRRIHWGRKPVEEK